MSSSINHHQIFSHDVKVKKEVRSVLGWPSNTFSIDSYRTSSTGMKGNCANDCSNDVLQPLEYPHTVLVFVPGNPGLVEWYISSFMEIVQRLGPGYAARAVSNAGHAVTADLTHPHKYDDEKDDDDAKSDCRGQDVEERSMRISWTIDGQVLHKCAYMDMLAEDFRQQLLSTTANARGCDEFSSGALQQQLPQYVLISHSIGAHFTQRLCVLRPDLLQRMQLLIHLTPFIQMKAPWPKQALLNILASRPHTTIAVHKRLMKFLRWCPKMFVAAMVDSTMKQADADTRQITTQLLRQPAFAKNFFALGLEEIRDVPKAIDIFTLRYIGRHCPVTMLFGGNDHWAPESVKQELQDLIGRGTFGDANIVVKLETRLKHDFVTDPITSVPLVVEFVVGQVRQMIGRKLSFENDQHAKAATNILLSKL